MLKKIEGKRKRGQQKSTFNFSSHSYPVPHSWIKPTKNHLVHVYLKNAHTSGHTEFKLMLIKGQLYTNNPQNSIMRKLQRLERSLHQRKCGWQVGIQKEVQHHFCCVQSLSHVQLFVTAWTVPCQSSLSFTISWSLLKFMSTEPVMLSNQLIFCHPLFLLPSIFPHLGLFH